MVEHLMPKGAARGAMPLASPPVYASFVAGNDQAVEDLSRFCQTAAAGRKPDELVKPEDFERFLSLVNPLLSSCADRMGEMNRASASNSATMEALADRIDRTQAESRAILDDLFGRQDVDG